MPDIQYNNKVIWLNFSLFLTERLYDSINLNALVIGVEVFTPVNGNIFLVLSA